jgi:SpoVK/Ycf46/Vps4 family AAA+-type ATPase
MAASADHIKALVKSHSTGDDQAFYAVVLQMAAKAARQGHHKLANDLKQLIDSSRDHANATAVTPLAQPRGELADLVVATYPNVGMRDLVVPPSLRDRLQEVLTEQRQRHRLMERGFNPVHRMLLEGPPGTGKTMTASVLAHELSLPLLTIRLDSVFSKFLGETASKLHVLFEAASQQRAVFFFDEFDALGSDRAGNDVGEARRILNSFLVFLENASPDSVVIAATNHRMILDRALFRRFDTVLTYALPTEEEAIHVLRGRLGPMAEGVRWNELHNQLAGLSQADLVKAAESAAKAVLLRGETSIGNDDLGRSLSEYRSDRA